MKKISLKTLFFLTSVLLALIIPFAVLAEGTATATVIAVDDKSATIKVAGVSTEGSTYSFPVVKNGTTILTSSISGDEIKVTGLTKATKYNLTVSFNETSSSGTTTHIVNNIAVNTLNSLSCMTAPMIYPEYLESIGLYQKLTITPATTQTEANADQFALRDAAIADHKWVAYNETVAGSWWGASSSASKAWAGSEKTYVEAPLEFPATGNYYVVANLNGNTAGREITVWIDGVSVKDSGADFTFYANAGTYRNVYCPTPVNVTKGVHTIKLLQSNNWSRVQSVAFIPEAEVTQAGGIAAYVEATFADANDSSQQWPLTYNAFIANHTPVFYNDGTGLSVVETQSKVLEVTIFPSTYIDEADVTYKLYLNDTLVATLDESERTYTIDTGVGVGANTIKVVAVVDGVINSEDSSVVSAGIEDYYTGTEAYYIDSNGWIWCDKSVSGGVVIPSTINGQPVKAIGGEAFGPGVTSVVIPEGVEFITLDAFINCTSLSEIIIPESVTEICRAAFYNTAYYNNESNWENGFLYKDNWLIAAKKDISGYHEVKSGTTNIACNAFGYCPELTGITIPEGVEKIPHSAFSNCTSLAEITIPKSITHIEYNAFDSCENLIHIYYAGSEEEWNSIEFSDSWGAPSDVKITFLNSIPKEEHFVLFGNSDGTLAISYDHSVSGDIVIPSTINGQPVTEILGEAFGPGVTSVVIPEGVEYIQLDTFINCTSLSQITIPESVTWIGYCAFYNCTSLADITIPKSVTEIAGHAFHNTAYYNNESNWENGVLYIDNWLIDAKEDISGYYEIKSGTTNIAGQAFNYCPELTGITIPEGVTNIPYKAFENCTSLAEITIPKSITHIEYDAFDSCENLTHIYYAGSEEEWNSIEISDSWGAPSDVNIICLNSSLIKAESISLNKTSIEIEKNSTETLVATVLPENATNKGVTWTSSDETIAKVSENGVVTGISYGTATITATSTDGGYTASCTVTVKKPTPEYRINSITVKDNIGNTLSEIPVSTFKVTISVTNISAECDSIIVLGTYTSTSELCDILFIETEDLPIFSTIKLTMPLDNTKGDISVIKALTWESFHSMYPLSDAVCFPSR